MSSISPRFSFFIYFIWLIIYPGLRKWCNVPLKCNKSIIIGTLYLYALCVVKLRLNTYEPLYDFKIKFIIQLNKFYTKSTVDTSNVCLFVSLVWYVYCFHLQSIFPKQLLRQYTIDILVCCCDWFFWPEKSY